MSSCQPLRNIRRWISRKPLEIQAWFPRTTIWLRKVKLVMPIRLWKVRRRCTDCVCNSWLAFTLAKDRLTLSCDCTRLSGGLSIAYLTHVRWTALQDTTTPEGEALWFQAARIPDSPKRSTITKSQSCVLLTFCLIRAVTTGCGLKIFLNGRRSWSLPHQKGKRQTELD